MSNGQVKKYSVRLYFLECPLLFGNRTSKILGRFKKNFTHDPKNGIKDKELLFLLYLLHL